MALLSDAEFCGVTAGNGALDVDTTPDGAVLAARRPGSTCVADVGLAAPVLDELVVDSAGDGGTSALVTAFDSTGLGRSAEPDAIERTCMTAAVVVVA